MPTPEEEFKEILSKTETYFKQEQELYGDTLFLDGPGRKMKSSTEGKEMQRAAEVDLFGNPVAAETQSSKVSEPQPFHYPNEPWVAAQSLDELNKLICNCT